MAQFRKKPVVIDAVRWLGWNWNEVCDFVPVPDVAVGDEENMVTREGLSRMPIIIHTLEGDMRAEIGDWIIRGVKGEYYPCKPDIFSMTYEPVALAAKPKLSVDQRVRILGDAFPGSDERADIAARGQEATVFDSVSDDGCWLVETDEHDLLPVTVDEIQPLAAKKD